MAHSIVKILSGDDLEERENPVSCLVIERCGDKSTFCHGEYFGYGASACKFEFKTVEKGGITCPDCLKRIKAIKDIDLG